MRGSTVLGEKSVPWGESHDMGRMLQTGIPAPTYEEHVWTHFIG
ncbi:MAG: hypothetical protein SOY64_10615 [Pyramidobacter sp.]|nr:hypothetical protein [Pyramidobacter sp.]MDY4033492.1 hypothetical protein [Pyramidobacter sp.]